MPKLSTAELRRRGYSESDIALARVVRDAAKRAGAPARSLAQILAGKAARGGQKAVLVDLTARQLRKRGGYSQAALLTDLTALSEPDPERAERARYLAAELAGLGRAKQLEFEFLGASNMVIGFQYIDAIHGRLMQADTTPAQRDAAMASLIMIARHLGWGSYACTKSATELAELRGVKTSNISRTLALLERVGAIRRIKRRSTTVITVTPEGAFRGDLSRHGEAVARYSAEVIPLHR